VLYGAPEEEDWRACGVVSEIMRRLNIPEGSYGTVVNVLLRRQISGSRDTREGATPC
jgi:hypothetical protein